MSRLAKRIRLLRPVTWLVVLLALATLGVPATEQLPQPRAGHTPTVIDYFAAPTRYFAARGEGIIICGICCSGDTACWTRLRTDFERANPPRGQIEGVCSAYQYKSERDPDTQKQVQRIRTPIYTRVRFNETEVLSSQYHDRNAGFEWQVGDAWAKFVRESSSTEFPESDGWRWANGCVSLNSPRNKEDQNWIRTQEQTSYKRVFMPTYGVADTPEERALEAKLEAERQAREKTRLAEEARQKQIAEAKAAEEARQRAAAEAARKAEIARVEAERQRKVDAIAEQLGPAKRAEAERLQRMNDQLAALRPKPRATPAPRQCTSRSGTQSVSNAADTEAAARSGIARAQGNIGGSETRTSNSVGPASCSQRNVPDLLGHPPVGNCFACISEKQAVALFGYIPGKGYPPPRTEWVCTATVTYTAERCGSGSSKVSAQ